ncbi:hypothetical protein [Streptomyces rishiriensis]|uniref:Secreted protein n=1 Tax=Streptomyces rishiriensis TaxID=68264 RepID=A0ABU0NFS3_STRRH|nr:hypothetical protein [Streptomyces rishiriensis]MDQ0577956.1 hypothetical protein [Streptomyces rishiriensis]
MLSFRTTFAGVALAAAAVMAGPGIASANDHSERGEGPAPYGQCNDFTTQLGAVNVNQGPVCINFGPLDEAGENKGGGDDTNFDCNAAVTQVGLVNVNEGPVCVDF